MIFSDFLSTLENGILVNARNEADNEIIKFYSGTTAIDDATEAMTVVKVKIVSATSISVILKNGD